MTGSGSTSDTVVYTAVFGGYDYIPTPRWAGPGVDFVCFTDRKGLRDIRKPWRAVSVERGDASPASMNRMLKIAGHPSLYSYKQSLYVDGNIALRRDPRPFISRALEHGGLAVPAHSQRSCVFDEISACIALGKIAPHEGLAFHEKLRASGFPRQRGLSDNSVIVRRQGDRVVHEFCSAWWHAVEGGPLRDQLHLQPVAMRLGYDVTFLQRTEYDIDGLFFRFPHRPQMSVVAKAFHRCLARLYPTPAGVVLERMYLWQRHVRSLRSAWDPA